MALIKIKQVDGLQAEVNKIVVVSEISSRDLLIDGLAQGYASDAESNAISTAAADATSKANTAESNAVATAAADATSKANTAESNAISSADTAAGSRDALVISTAASDATSKANTAESNAISTADTAAGSRDALVLTSADLAAGSRDALIKSAATALEGRVDTIEDKLIQDDEFLVETYAGAPNLGPYTLTNPVQDDEVELVWAYVNGLSVEVDSVAGTDVVLVDPGYGIEAGDVVKFHYQFIA